MAKPQPQPARSRSVPLPPSRRTEEHPLDQPASPPPAAPAAPPAPSVPGEAPTLGEISATPASQRRQLNIGVPESLMLHRRAGLYRLDHRVDVQDQVAAALDAWLRERGY
ncbi:hypothetical protein GCM10027294_53590 [Marinactinospora endophytica]